jgi:2-aminoadipate transaminase
MSIKISSRMSRIKASEIREILKISQRPEVISFAGGLPAPELFPIEEIIKANEVVLHNEGKKALQYTTTEGYEPLRSFIASRMNRRFGTSLDADNILITHGSQQALDLSGRVFLDEGDVVLCESPTYLAAIAAFKAYGCRFISVPTDNNGMDMDSLEKLLSNTPKVKIVYVIPDFQNPTGRTWSIERRKRLVQLSEKYNVAVVEDNPYGELRYEGEHIPAVKSFDRCGNVLFTSTFSKIFCPGFRIGWIAGNKDIIDKYILSKQAADLQCNTLAQMVIYKYTELFDIDKHINNIKDVYRKRRDVLIGTMEREFPKSIVFEKPNGGLFTWVELTEGVNTSEIFEKSLEMNVAFVPGASFYPNDKKLNTFRLNFSNMSEDKIVKGIKRLAKILHVYV